MKTALAAPEPRQPDSICLHEHALHAVVGLKETATVLKACTSPEVAEAIDAITTATVEAIVREVRHHA